MTAVASLPHWDLTDVWPSPSSPQFAAAQEHAGAAVTRLDVLYDERGVGTVAPHPPSAEEVADVEEVLTTTNEVLRQLQRVGTYLLAHVATDATDAVAQTMLSRLQLDQARVNAL